MDKNKSLAGRLERQMLQLAQARVNDAVKLAYLDPQDRDLIDRMDLTALTEFKRAGTGATGCAPSKSCWSCAGRTPRSSCCAS